MHILFYINPFIVRGNPSFYEGAIEKKLIKQAKNLLSKGNEVSFLVNEMNCSSLQEMLPEAGIYTISQQQIYAHIGSLNNIEIEIYNKNESKIETLIDFMSGVLPKGVDSIICWETPGNFLREIYPEASLIHEMPGFMSRIPYPELFTLDTKGLFNESWFSDINNFSQHSSNEQSKEIIEFIRKDLLTFISDNNPFDKVELDPLFKFEKLILLPLQVTDQYAFISDSNYQSQMALLLDVLMQTPLHIGVVVTQYNSASTSDTVINTTNFKKLKELYPNLIWDEKFNKIDNISQYLLASVDAVATISSSIGMQALLWNKPLIGLTDNYMANIASHKSIRHYIESNFNFDHALYDRILSWCLTYQQPLASLVLNSPSFLNDWLLAIKQNNNNLPNLFELVDGYKEKFIASSKLDLAEKVLRKNFPSSNNSKLSESFKKIINDKKPKIISFDIFDTLVDRVIEQPSHLFKMLENKVDTLTKGALSNFQVARQNAEKKLRAEIFGEEKQEITLDEIYLEISRSCGLTLEICDQIKNLEIQDEIKVLKRRIAGWKLFNIAKESGAKVILISDMYLPEDVIRNILINSGYEYDIPLYLSSTIGLRKHEGELFSYVREKEAISYEDWLHVGDNPHGDISRPKEFGISTYQIKSAFRIIEGNKKLSPLLKEDRRTRSNAESAIYGLIQRKFFDNPYNVFPSDTHFGGNTLAMGYIGLAPLLFGFLQWTMTQAKNDGVDKLLFLSRDGKVLWRMAKILFPSSEGWPEIDYAMSSRRAARVSSIYNRNDISKLVDSSIAATTLDFFFLGKFGINIDPNDDYSEFGFSSYNCRVTQQDREKLRELANYLSEKILGNADSERKLLVEHYKQLGVNASSKIGVVDIGYAGTMQVAMESITDAKSINGYYYITFDSALESIHKTGVMRGYAGDFVKRTIHSDLICRNGFLYETLFCSSDSTFVCFKQDTLGKIMPQFSSSPLDNVRQTIVERAHDSAVMFAKDLKESFSDKIQNFHINSTTASRMLNDLIIKPSGRDAEIFEGCIFDDGFSGSKVRYIVPPREIIAKGKYSISDVVWKEGTAVFGRRPDLFPKDTVKKNIAKIAPALATKNNTSIKKKGMLFKFESIIFKSMIRNKRKKDKYFNNRELFFSDSKSTSLTTYWKIMGNKI